MEHTESTDLDAALQRLAEEKFGRARAEELRKDIRQMAGELEALSACKVGFEDEP